ncbi:MAG TPA: hypothetical protein VHM64_06620, partial [Candidatus Binatia bacterium]|nr:hypothetical protein [Candidatus Binatia bacterium]
MTQNEQPKLAALARLFNVQTAHYDGLGHKVEPPAEAILTVLGTLGAAVDRMSDLSNAVRERRQFLWNRVIDPVVTVWEGNSPRIKVRLPKTSADSAVNYELELEGGAVLRGGCVADPRFSPVARMIEGREYIVR